MTDRLRIMEKQKVSQLEENLSTKKIGLIVNPIAGMGGPVGLKGTDGKEILNKAISLGASPVAPIRASLFLNKLEPMKSHIELLTAGGLMGEEEALIHGFSPTVIDVSKNETTAEDTIHAAKKTSDENVDLLVFCGGDGTARDILKGVGMRTPVLGVPTGVKMHSAVFAVTPVAAADVSMNFLWRNLPLREAEVMDVDENLFREGRVSAELYGYVLTPYEPHLIQANKLASPMTENEMRNQAAIAIDIIESMQPNLFYILGPGTTTRTIVDLLDEKKTLLGVDVLLDRKIIRRDVTEKQLLELLSERKAEIIVTPIGGQGFIFGRGNQQISPKVIRKVGKGNVTVIATESKLATLTTLKVDTGDQKLDGEFRKCEIDVISDYKIRHPMNVE